MKTELNIQMVISSLVEVSLRDKYYDKFNIIWIIITFFFDYHIGKGKMKASLPKSVEK